MDDQQPSKAFGIVLVGYLLLLCAASTAFLIYAFPSRPTAEAHWKFPAPLEDKEAQGFLLIALAAGITGSFIQAAQSLSTYLGNQEFKRSWGMWYFLRPWIGGVLGISIYVAVRAGLVSSTDVANPYGIAALSLLGGWFSKTTSDKLQEVFETMFKTTEDQKRKDKLTPSGRPTIDSIDPSPVPAGQFAIVVKGQHFVTGAVVVINGSPVDSTFVSDSQLRVEFDAAKPRPAAGAVVDVQVKNPNGAGPLSNALKLAFN